MGMETFTQVLKETKLGISPQPNLGKWTPWAWECAKGISLVWSNQEIGARRDERCTKVGCVSIKGNDDWQGHGFVWSTKPAKGRDDSFGRPGPWRGTTIHLDTWFHKGVCHPQRTRWVAMVTYEVPIREQGRTTIERQFEDKASKKSFAVLRQG